MSWAVEEWKDGLPGKALQKIQEMEVQLDKLKKEKTQKQFQLDSLEAALQKQKQKVNIYQKCLNKCVLWETNWHIYLKRYPIKTFKISLRNTSPTHMSLFLQVDSERTETSALKRENQSLLESCDSLEKARQKAVHDLGVKEQQVSFWWEEEAFDHCRINLVSDLD